MNLTQAEVANYLDVTRHMMIRLEQALFAEPPPLALIKLSNLYCISEEELLESYHKYQVDSRLAFAATHSNFDLLWNYSGSEHPLIYWRTSEDLSSVGLAKGLCVHQGLLYAYEANKQRDLPEDFSNAISFIDWDLLPLTTAVAAWRIKWR